MNKECEISDDVQSFFLMELVFDYGTMGLMATVRTYKQGPGSDTGSDMVLSVLQSLLGAG